MRILRLVRALRNLQDALGTALLDQKGLDSGVGTRTGQIVSKEDHMRETGRYLRSSGDELGREGTGVGDGALIGHLAAVAGLGVAGEDGGGLEDKAEGHGDGELHGDGCCWGCYWGLVGLLLVVGFVVECVECVMGEDGGRRVGYIQVGNRHVLRIAAPSLCLHVLLWGMGAANDGAANEMVGESAGVPE